MIKSIIVAIAENNVIGKDNDLIWHISEDLKRFKRITTGNCIIMGRKTFESIGKPLPNRTSIIITRNKNYKQEGCIIVNSLEEAYLTCKDQKEVFIIGGGEIYNEAYKSANKLYLTKVHENFEGDTFFPEIQYNDWTIELEEKYEPTEKCKHAYSFINLIKK